MVRMVNNLYNLPGIRECAIVSAYKIPKLGGGK